MKQIVIKSGEDIVDSWVLSMSELLPEFKILPFNSPELIEQKEVSYVIGWCPDADCVNSFPNIKGLVSIGSGVDHIINLDRLRSEIPVIRTVAPELIQRMREFASMCVLSWHRQLIPILEANKSKRWDRFVSPLASDITVGIMGYGGMGKAVAELLTKIGYNVCVWANSSRSNEPYKYYSGKSSLSEFASKCDVLICLIPLTEETKGILDYELFSSMKKGGCLINVGRGLHLNEQDLERAMQEDLLSHAFLDCLYPEPLPPDAFAWTIKNSTITCHSGASIPPEVGAKIIAKNIRLFEKGLYDGPMYDSKLGY
ncbi:MAG: NAD(P)-binding domain-containing protein [Oscillospiraceae bacterium]|nr:NAD(P)-binding domain-containing protein [Oscillospiraceae bacterium]